MTGFLALTVAFTALAVVSPWLALLAVSPWVIEFCWEALR